MGLIPLVLGVAFGQEVHRGFLGPGGLVAQGHHAVLGSADTELSGYPTGMVGWRMGVAPWADFGVELGGNDKAQFLRLHSRLRLVEEADGLVFSGLRLRVEAKRHRQDFPPGEFRSIDDLGATIIPELSVGFRPGARRHHAFGWFGYAYLDLDVRPGFGPEAYIVPGGLFYEHAPDLGLRVLLNVAVGFEIGKPETADFLIPRIELVLGWVAPRRGGAGDRGRR